MWLFSDIEARTEGDISQVDIPLGTYLYQSLLQGQHDQAGSSVSRMTELNLAEDEGLMLEPEQAQERYGLPGLRFQRKISEGQAKLLHERKLKEIDRDYYLEQGLTGPFRWASGTVAQMVGSVLHPMDFGLMFVPVVGQEAKLRPAMGPLRRLLARGVITEEQLAARKLRYPKFTASFIDAAAGNAAAEIPILISAQQDQARYGIEDSAINIVGGGLLGGGLRVGLERLYDHIFKRLDSGTKQVMFDQAVEQIVKGEDVQVEHIAATDPVVAREVVMYDPVKTREDAQRALDEQMPGIREKIRQEFSEEVVAAAARMPDGTIKTGRMHSMIPDLPYEDMAAGKVVVEMGYMTSRGRFLPNEQLHEIAGKTLLRSVAIRYKGKVYEGRSHYEIITTQINQEHPEIQQFLVDGGNLFSPEQVERLGIEEGFVSAEGRFLNRQESLEAAKQHTHMGFEHQERQFWSRPDVVAEVKSHREKFIRNFMRREREKAKREGRYAKQDARAEQPPMPREEVAENTHEAKLAAEDVSKIEQENAQLEKEILGSKGEAEIRAAVEALQQELEELGGAFEDIDKAIEAAERCVRDNG